MSYTIIEICRQHGKTGPITFVKMRNGHIYSRAEVVGFINAGYEFVVPSGERVHVVRVGLQTFLRTDRNQTPEDNLGELPLFEHP